MSLFDGKTEDMNQTVKSEENNEKVDSDRRKFAKMLGVGAVGLGATTMLPSASALTIRPDSIEMNNGNINELNQLNGQDADSLGGGGSVVGVNAADYSGSDGGQQIQNAIDDADSSSGFNYVVVPPDGPDDVSGSSGSSNTDAWQLSSSLQIPDNTVLVLDNAYLFLSDGADDNLIRNASADSGDSTRNSNIHIVGQGDVRLDGNASNQTDLTSDGTRYLNHGIHLYKVDRFSIRNIEVGPTNAFAVVPEDANDGYINNIEISQNGNTGNQDGVHVHGPGNDIRIQNISGSTGDDFFAADADGSNSNSTTGWSRGGGGDLSHVIITDSVMENTGKAGSLLRTIGSSNGTLDGVYMNNCIRKGTPGTQLIKFGWSNAAPTADQMKNIHLENIRGGESGGTQPVIHFRDNSSVKNVTIKNLHITEASNVLSNPSPSTSQTIENFEVNGFLFETSNDVGGFLFDNANVTFNGIRFKNGKTLHTGTSTKDAFSIGSGTWNDFIQYQDIIVDGWNQGFNVTGNGTYNKRIKFEKNEFTNTGTTDYSISQDGVVIDGLATESANAEEPQLGYQQGIMVEFTDTGDGSGDGVYINTSGGWQSIS